MKRIVLTATALLVLAVPPAPAPARARATITMSGASRVQAVVADLAYFYRRETRRPPQFSFVGGGTEAGLADAARGIVDAGLSDRALRPGDPSQLRFTPLALSAVCLVTNSANPVPNITRAQLQDLVAGRATAWSQVPGSPRSDPIVTVAFDRISAARSVFESVFVNLGTPQAPAVRTFTTAASVRDYIAAIPPAWGYIDLEFAHTLHTVPYEGVDCTRATLVSGAYPARRTLGFVTRGAPKGALARFLRWVKRDPTAKRVIGTRYVVPS